MKKMMIAILIAVVVLPVVAVASTDSSIVVRYNSTNEMLPGDYSGTPQGVANLIGLELLFAENGKKTTWGINVANASFSGKVLACDAKNGDYVRGVDLGQATAEAIYVGFTAGYCSNWDWDRSEKGFAWHVRGGLGCQSLNYQSDEVVMELPNAMGLSFSINLGVDYVIPWEGKSPIVVELAILDMLSTGALVRKTTAPETENYSFDFGSVAFGLAVRYGF